MFFAPNSIVGGFYFILEHILEKTSFLPLAHPATFVCMDGKYSDIELLFIREVLDQHGEFVVDKLQDEIEKLKLRDSDDLLNSLDYKTTNYGLDPVLQISFLSYGRAIEIRWHKMRKNRDMFQRSANRDVWGIQQKQKRRKKANWYARTAYGSVNRLLSILSTEYSEEERKRLKGILDRQKMKLA